MPTPFSTNVSANKILLSIRNIYILFINGIILSIATPVSYVYRPLGYERVNLPLCKVTDIPFDIQEDELLGRDAWTPDLFQSFFILVRIIFYIKKCHYLW